VNQKTSSNACATEQRLGNLQKKKKTDDKARPSFFVPPFAVFRPSSRPAYQSPSPHDYELYTATLHRTAASSLTRPRGPPVFEQIAIERSPKQLIQGFTVEIAKCFKLFRPTSSF